MPAEEDRMRNDDMAVVVNGVRKTYGKGKIVAGHRAAGGRRRRAFR
ncbi:daunorubicin-dim-transport ATP-binding protein ABC transporter drrA [Mycobacterium tuberculosis]|nr:daunorubicin-dim-transport ATP-binding protein ABC transporter drrA [Mycobacterium tuberculosis]